MSRGEFIRTLLIALVAGGVAFAIAHYLSLKTEPRDEVAWVIEEFDLTAAQAAEVRELHDAYRPICDAHCEAVMAAQTALEQADTAEARTLAERELELLKQRCHEATLDHLRSVAAVMPAAQGQRYLETITPLLSSHEHEAPFGLR